MGSIAMKRLSEYSPDDLIDAPLGVNVVVRVTVTVEGAQ